MANPRPAALSDYHDVVWYELETGGGHSLRVLRDQLDRLDMTPEQISQLHELDQLAVEYIQEADDEALWPALIEDDTTQPLNYWWWHLGKLRAGIYPAELLPPHLRVVYMEQMHEAQI
jgi:hypothetical protein